MFKNEKLKSNQNKIAMLLKQTNCRPLHCCTAVKNCAFQFYKQGYTEHKVVKCFSVHVDTSLHKKLFIHTSKYNVGKGRRKWRIYHICRKFVDSLEVFFGLAEEGECSHQETGTDLADRLQNTVGCPFKLKAFDLGELFLNRLCLIAIKTLHFPYQESCCYGEGTVGLISLETQLLIIITYNYIL